MKTSIRVQIAFCGAVWFGVVAVAMFLLFMSALSKPFAPENGADLASYAKFSAWLFGVPSAVAGGVLANRIANADGPIGSFFLGITLVLLANLLAGVMLGLVELAGARPLGTVGTSLFGAASFVLLDLLLFKGAPFVVGGLASLAFRPMARWIVA